MRPAEVLVVDNMPSTDATRDMVKREFSEANVRYLRETRLAGGSAARNTGARNARGAIVAFIDDDELPDRHWLAELLVPFAADRDVACVTGLVLPQQLDTPAQLRLEAYGGYSKGFVERRFDLREHRPPDVPLFPYNAGMLGSGGSMAFRRETFIRLGGLDICLGNGTASRGGEDIDLLFRVIQSGSGIVYNPRSLAYHPHHRLDAQLRRQVFSYGVGLAAFLTKSAAHRPRAAMDILARLPAGLLMMANPNPSSSTSASGLPLGGLVDYPASLRLLEVAGMAWGPFAYARTALLRRRLRRDRETAMPPRSQLATDPIRPSSTHGLD
jgi:GT2 family glycosyltransferase